MNPETEQVLRALREDLARVESKLDKVLSLVDLIPNPFVRKAIRSKIGGGS